MAKVFEKLRDDTEFTDCTIIVNSIKFECHKVVLGIASEFFRYMFLRKFKEASSREVHLEDVTPVIFKIFRDYIYNYDITTLASHDMRTLISLFECGNMWMAPTIINGCAEIILNRANSYPIEELPMLFNLGHKHNNTILIHGITNILEDANRIPPNSSFLLKKDIFNKFISFCRVNDSNDIAVNYLNFNRYLAIEENKPEDQEE